MSLPERERIVPYKRLALPHQKGTVGRSGLQAVLRQQPFSDLSPVTSGTQLPVEPLLRHVLVHTVTDLQVHRRQCFSLYPSCDAIILNAVVSTGPSQDTMLTSA